MRRWHQEQNRMLRLWKMEMGIHGYDWRCPPTDKSACHCVTGIGFFRKKRPFGHHCHCLSCNWEKYMGRKRRRAEAKKEIKLGLELE